MKRKILSGLLALCMAFTIMPMQTFATTGGEPAPSTSSVKDSGSTCTCPPVDGGELMHGEGCPLYVPPVLATTPVGRQGRGATNNTTGLFAGRYSSWQVYDCQRDETSLPAVKFYLFQKNGVLKGIGDDKIFYFKRGASDSSDFSLYYADDVDGKNEKQLVASGQISALNDIGFLYTTKTNPSQGIFIGNRIGYLSAQSADAYIPKDNVPITHTDADSYNAKKKPQIPVTMSKIITFAPNGSSVTPTFSWTDYYNKLESLPTPLPRFNHSFDGWFTDMTGGTKVTTDTVFTKDDTIFARWTYTGAVITFNANGGSVTTTSGTTNRDNKLESLPTPTRDDYRFDGWFTAASGGEKVTTDTLFTKASTIFAHWTNEPTATKYAVTVTGGSTDKATAAKNEIVTITAATPVAGKVFDTWTNTDGVTFTNATAATTTFTMPEKAVTVVATYKDKPVTPPSTSGGGGGSSSTPPPVSSVINNPVGSGSATQLADAVKTAVAAGKASEISYLTYANYTALTKDGLKAITDATAAAAKGTKLQLNTQIQLDNSIGGVVSSRITIDPAKLTPVMPDRLDLNVWYNQATDTEVITVNEKFNKYFTNKLYTITFEEKTPLAVNMQLALKTDFSGLNTKNLYFYSYNPTTNIYTRIATPAYSVDKMGYSHITAPFGGSIIITDKPLTKR